MTNKPQPVAVPATQQEPPTVPEITRDFRFRCGHVESEGAATQRMRRHTRAVWISCRSCNVIAVALMPPSDGAGQPTA